MATGDYMGFNSEEQGAYLEVERESNGTDNLGFCWNNPRKDEERDKIIQRQRIPSSIGLESKRYNATTSIQLENTLPELIYTGGINQEMFVQKTNEVQNCHNINEVQNCHTWDSTYLDGGQNIQNFHNHGNNKSQESHLQKGFLYRESKHNPNPMSDMTRFSGERLHEEAFYNKNIQLQESYLQKGVFHRDTNRNPISDMTRLHVEEFPNKDIQDISHYLGTGDNVESFKNPNFQFPQYTDITLPSATLPEANVQPFFNSAKLPEANLQPCSNKSIQDISLYSGRGHNVESFRNPNFQFPQYTDITLPSATLSEVKVHPFSHKSIQSQQFPQPSGMDPHMEDSTNSQCRNMEAFSRTGNLYQHYPDVLSVGGNMEALFNKTNEAQECQDMPQPPRYDPWTNVVAFSRNYIPYQHCPDISGADGDVNVVPNESKQSQQSQDIPGPSATWQEIKDQLFCQNSIHSQPFSQDLGRILGMEDLSHVPGTWKEAEAYSNISSVGSDVEGLCRNTDQAKRLKDMEPCSNTSLAFERGPHIIKSSDDDSDVEFFYNSRFEAEGCFFTGSTKLDQNQQCPDTSEGNPGVHSNEKTEPAVEYCSKPKRSRIRWNFDETTDLVKFKAETDEMFKCGKWSEDYLWNRIASKLNSIYTFRKNGFTSTVCCQKWNKLLQEVKRKKNEGQTIGGHLKDLEYIDRNPSNDPNELAWSLEEILYLVVYRKEMDAKFKIFKDKHAGPWGDISLRLKYNNNYEKTPRACSEKWVEILQEYSASKKKGEPIQGYLRIVKSIVEEDRSVMINFHTVSRRVFIYKTATPESITQAIKWTFGLETTFWLEDETGIVQKIDSGMPLNKIYNICL